ncbi:DUF3164 family protein [Chitinibacter sp. S2-10]|uniref:DUF3164 family protein n=1 Tax=Chitinibacter sp. S2-10 TaxID=3373597 RepID=UPI00397784DA
MSDVVNEKYREDAKGHLVPIETIKPIDLLRDDLVLRLAAQAKQVSGELTKFKQVAFAEIGDFLDQSASRYGVTMRGAAGKGNISLFSFDGRYKIQRNIQDVLAFDEGLQAAKVLIDECMREWSEHSAPEMRAIVERAFKVDKKGQISTSAVLSLRSIESENPKWNLAMQAVADALTVQCSRSYVRVYERIGKTDQYKAIPLDIAGA